MKQTITARITFDPSHRLDPENDYDPEVDLISIMDYGRDRFNVDSYAIISVGPAVEGEAKKNGDDQEDQQFTVVISTQTRAANAKEALTIALAQISDGSAYAEVKSIDGAGEEGTISELLAH